MSHNIWHILQNPGSALDSKKKRRRDARWLRRHRAATRRKSSSGRQNTGGASNNPYTHSKGPKAGKRNTGGARHNTALKRHPKPKHTPRQGTQGDPYERGKWKLPGRHKKKKGHRPHAKGHGGEGKFGGHPPKGHGKGHGGKRHGHKGRGSKGGGGGKRGMMGYGFGRYHGPKRSNAANMVDRDINRQIRDYISDIKQARKQGEYDVNKADALFDRSKGDINYIFGEAADTIGAKNKAIDDRFGQTSGELANLYNALKGQQQGNIDKNRDAIIQEQARMKLADSGMGPVGLDRFGSDAAFAQNMAAQNQTNALANLASQQKISADVGSTLAGMSSAAQASAIGRVTNNNLENIQDIRQQTRGQMNDILDDIRKVKANRPQMVNELWNQMDQNAFQRFMDTNQADFNNQLAANQFNLDVAKLNSDNQFKKGQAKRDWWKAKQEVQMRREKAARAQINKQARVNAQALTSAIMPWF